MSNHHSKPEQTCAFDAVIVGAGFAITRKAKGVSIKTTVGELAPYMRGWRSYFGFCETPEVLIALTRWVRLRLRAALWRQWKTPRRRRAALIALRVAGELCNTAVQAALRRYRLLGDL